MNNDERETPERQEARLELEHLVRGIAESLREALPRSVGFAVALFDFGDKGSMAYAANAKREDVVKMLGELRDKIRRQ